VRHLWHLDERVTFLNHGSFGACPRAVMDAAEAVRTELEREPVRFMVGELEARLDEARSAVGALLGAAADDVVFVPNATAGVSTVLASLALAPGDELVTIDHAYNACRNALDRAAERTGARVRVAALPFPTPGDDAVVEAVVDQVTPRTRLVLVDLVTSPTALVLPVRRLVAELAARGVDTLVDAAHGPGMVPLDLDAVGAAYTAGNFHKWLCAPKGAGFLHVRRDRQEGIHPLVTSHGKSSSRRDRSRFRLEHDWTGTFDPAPSLCVPEAIRFLERMPGGIGGWMARNHEAALAARRTLCAALHVEPPCPDAMIGAMVSLPLPLREAREERHGPFDPLQETLFSRFGIEVPVFTFPAHWSTMGALPASQPIQKLFRVSTPAYVTPADVERLAGALVELGMAEDGPARART
jgi:isopenicillin-N epimerase